MKKTKSIFWSLILLIGVNNFILSQTKTEKESITISTGHPSITMKAIRYKNYLEVRVYNNNTSKTYKVDFSVIVTLHSDKAEYKRPLETSVILRPNKENYAMDSGGSHYANSSTREFFSSLIDAKLENFTWSEVKDNSTANQNNYTSTSYKEPETEVRYSTNLQVKGAAERQNRLNALQQGQVNAQKAAQDWAAQNEIRSQQYKKEQQELSNAVVNVTTELVNIFQQNAREREEREERERQAKLRIEQEEFTRKQAFEIKIASRKATIKEFPSKNMPLSSQEKAPKIYYFIYAYDESLNNEYGATVYLSNVFEIAKFNDGTWPYQNMINNEILLLTPVNEVIHGYYYTQEEADSLRNTFIILLANLGVNIKDIYYKGKPNANATTNNVIKKEGESKYGKTISITDQNTAPATLNPPKKGDFKIRDDKEKPKESKYGKTIKMD